MAVNGKCDAPSRTLAAEALETRVRYLIYTQRSESYHPINTKITNGQLTLEASAKALVNTCLAILKDLKNNEASSLIKASKYIDLQAFSNVFGKMSLQALGKVGSEWEEVKKKVSKDYAISANSSCQCELLLRYSLPCRHYLLRACKTGQRIPQTPFYPRWWLQGRVRNPVLY